VIFIGATLTSGRCSIRMSRIMMTKGSMSPNSNHMSISLR
jgi:hypothetical protein